MYQVRFTDHGSICVAPGTTVLEAAHQLGIPLGAPCGGHGKCGKCKVTANGAEVLACRHIVTEDTTVVIPTQAAARILTAGALIRADLDPLHPGYLIAIDIGTTTVVCCLLSPQGEELSTQSMLNPQASYGADVVSRIQWAIRESGQSLTNAIRTGITELIQECCDQANISPAQIGVVSIVGNSCMQQLFWGISVSNLASVPFAPVIVEAKAESARDHLPICPNAMLLTVPDIAGFVGADTMGCILAAGLHKTEKTVLMVDIGTNGEMVLAHQGKLAACATAAGPALEGANIHFGMRGAAGAIDHVRLQNGQIQCSIIGGGSARGICGSGIIDAVAVMLEAGLLNRRGRIQGADKDNLIFGLCDGIYLAQEDIRQVQLAKGAISAGIALLCSHFGIDTADIDQVLLAGAFGSYMDPESACRIGLLPPGLSDRITAVGNLALSGAKMLALDRKQLHLTQQLLSRINSIELSQIPAFRRTFAKCMEFPV